MIFEINFFKNSSFGFPVFNPNDQVTVTMDLSEAASGELNGIHNSVILKFWGHYT